VSKPRFDPDTYKRSTREQWQTAAEPWHRWGPTLEDWLSEATEAMLDMADVRAGGRVLDVAAGAGGQTLSAARRVGPEGAVLATDISEVILAFAEQTAREAGLTNVTTRVMDGESLDVPDRSFDAVISRVGFIYFPNQHAAFVGMRDALKPGGRLAGIVYSTPEANRFFSIPISIIRRRAQLPAPAPGQPGPFSLGSPGVAEQAFADAGFRDVAVEAVPSPLRMDSTADCVRFERDSFGALHQMLSGLAEADRRAAWAEIEQALAQFEGPDGFVAPCEMLVVSGVRP
jgi:SAM-dependent methyltransferase